MFDIVTDDEGAEQQMHEDEGLPQLDGKLWFVLGYSDSKHRLVALLEHDRRSATLFSQTKFEDGKWRNSDYGYVRSIEVNRDHALKLAKIISDE